MRPVHVRLLGLVFLAGLLAVAQMRLSTASLMAQTAQTFLASLDTEQRSKAQLPFDSKDGERTFWHYIPAEDIPKRFNKPRRGLPLLEMTPQQKHFAHALLSSGLSQRGNIKAVQVMALDEVLRALENDSGVRRNPTKYFFTIFGEPSEKGTWGYRIEGHHLSLHYTISNGRIAASPTFYGANPAKVLSGPLKGLRVLAAEEDRGRELLQSLTPEQKKIAIVSATAPNDILTAADRKAALKGQPSGLSAEKMTPAQRELLRNLLEEYAGNVTVSLWGARREMIKRAGTRLYFAWAGVEEVGGPHYYRVQGPDFLIEYDNTQNKANHIHSVWRELNADFGDEILSSQR
ncbi:MAG: DUF3500 domain-containing protein [Bryobacter sp.]|nr:DUF3500 domain-containing protein [Bryobacter sp.]